MIVSRTKLILGLEAHMVTHRLSTISSKEFAHFLQKEKKNMDIRYRVPAPQGVIKGQFQLKFNSPIIVSIYYMGASIATGCKISSDVHQSKQQIF